MADRSLNNDSNVYLHVDEKKTCYNLLDLFKEWLFLLVVSISPLKQLISPIQNTALRPCRREIFWSWGDPLLFSDEHTSLIDTHLKNSTTDGEDNFLPHYTVKPRDG